MMLTIQSKCAKCNGTGKYKNGKCPICGGSGIVFSAECIDDKPIQSKLDQILHILGEETKKSKK